AAPPELEFFAYGEDGRLSGRIRLDASRISDILNAYDEYLLLDVLATSYTDRTELRLPEILVRRDELLLVHASGPRGDEKLRMRTVERGMTMKLGRYLVSGNVHAPRGVDPFIDFRHRREMVPLTDAVIEFNSPDGPIFEVADTVVVNRTLVDWVRPLEAGATWAEGVYARPLRPADR
ncbi:MAG: hypothetical protein ABI555_03170, partial [Chloroflexota bacterium]